jgi:enamine deaminase RidA (YjgF/YER057c/UK114 family)
MPAAHRRLVPAGTAWATMLAYSRAVVDGRHVYVSGTLPVDAEGALVGGDDAYLQARQVLLLLQQALAAAGCSVDAVVRLRIYLRDSADIPAVARAQYEVFESVRPACTVLVTSLAGPDYRVQMDADALLPAAP